MTASTGDFNFYTEEENEFLDSQYTDLWAHMYPHIDGYTRSLGLSLFPFSLSLSLSASILVTLLLFLLVKCVCVCVYRGVCVYVCVCSLLILCYRCSSKRVARLDRVIMRALHFKAENIQVNSVYLCIWRMAVEGGRMRGKERKRKKEREFCI